MPRMELSSARFSARRQKLSTQCCATLARSCAFESARVA
jgi:hypothetical protein